MRKKKGVCGICFLELDGNIVACPACKKKFHEDHLAAWLRLRNNKCPHCREELPKEFIEELTPQTREEKEYLDSLEYLFGDMGKFNRISSVIETRRTQLRTNKIIYYIFSILLLIFLPISFFILKSIYESMGVTLLIASLSLYVPVYVILIKLLLKTRKTLPELEKMINMDRQRLIDL